MGSSPPSVQVLSGFKEAHDEADIDRIAVNLGHPRQSWMFMIIN